MKKQLLTIPSLLAFLLLTFAPMQSAKANEVEQCFTYLDAQDYEKAIDYGEIAVEKNPKNADAYFCLGVAYHKTGDFNKALDNMKKAEELVSSKEDLMIVHNWVGSIYEKMGLLDDALLYYSRGLSLAKDLKDVKSEAILLNDIAGVYDKKGKFDKALEYYEMSLGLQSDEKEKATTYNNIGLVYGKKRDYHKAIEYFKKALDTYEKYGNYHYASYAILNLGNTLRKIKDFESAEKYLFDGLEKVKIIGDKYLEATTYHYLGWLYRDKGDKETAKKYLMDAYNLYKSIGAMGDADGVLEDLAQLDKQDQESEKPKSEKEPEKPKGVKKKSKKK